MALSSCSTAPTARTKQQPHSGICAQPDERTSWCSKAASPPGAPAASTSNADAARGVMGGGCPLCGYGLSTFVLLSDGERLVRCRHCGLLYQDPRPAAAVRQHYDNLYEDARGSGHIDVHRRALFH